jgi:hypothetical protein
MKVVKLEMKWNSKDGDGWMLENGSNERYRKEDLSSKISQDTYCQVNIIGGPWAGST